MNFNSNNNSETWGEPKTILKTQEFSDNKLFVLIKNENNTYTLFLGKPWLSKEKLRHQPSSEMDFYYYDDNFIFYIDFEQNDNKEPQPYIGEKIDFKTNDQFDDELVSDLFNSLAKGLKANKWMSLMKALSDISDWLSSFTKNEINSRLKGYLGEMALVWSIMNDKEIPNNLDFAKLIFDSYQKTTNERHDFLISPQLRLEVKSTSKDNLSFRIKMSQQIDVANIQVFYAFVKYNLVQASLGKNLEDILNDIHLTLNLEEADFPNHLFVQTLQKKTNSYYIDPNNIEIYVFAGEELPQFGNNDTGNIISDIQYRLNIYNFLKSNSKSYDKIAIFNRLYQLMKGMVKNDKSTREFRQSIS